jgi:hypothetical protein
MSRKSTMTTENDDVVLFTAGTERGLITQELEGKLSRSNTTVAKTQYPVSRRQ